jgi:hypothetical protein
MTALKAAFAFALNSSSAYFLFPAIALLLCACMQTQAQSQAQHDSEGKLQGKVEKLGGDGRITRPMLFPKTQTPKSGAGIFTPSNFDLSIKKAPTPTPAAGIFDTHSDELFKKDAKTNSQNLSTQTQAQTQAQAPAKITGLQLLKDYDVFFLIDSSASMNMPDCPSKNPEEPVISRWEWTGEAIRKFTEETHEILKQGVTIILYNDTARKVENCHEKELAAIFSNNYPHGGTLLARSLHEALSRPFNSRPCFIIVIGDGAAQDQGDVERELFLASSEHGSEKKLKILMTQVGEDPDSHVYRGSLSSATWMIHKTAITQYVPFRELKVNGFGKIIEGMLSQH